MLTVHYSNRLDTLANALASLTREPLASAFSPEIVLVQSRGVARWLSLRLADASEICANVRFPFPNAYAWQLYRALAPDVPETSPFDPQILVWRILALLPAHEDRPEFESVRNYVAGDPLRRYELAVRLAGLFDQYLLYRPDWITEWEGGRAKEWQAVLWRTLVKDAAVPHRARLHATLLEQLTRGTGPADTVAAELPERLSLFGAPALAPSLLALLEALARHVDVHLFLHNPCREYWGDIREAGEIARKAAANDPGAALLDVGNALLASLGKQGRDFFDLLTDIESAQTRECFVDPDEATLLGAIQADILNLRDRTPPASVAIDDHSVQIHACHSAMREVEVLHDQLLALFSAHPDLEPSDIIVMAPDIEAYAPYIEAVFGTRDLRIPYNVSDRSAQHESALAATFMALLDLAGSRYDANRVLGLLDEVAVRRRFGLTEGDLDTISRWVRTSQIRWGIDGAHRARLGLPATHEHTWRFGLERLLLGYALPGGGERLFDDILPYDDIEGSLGETLGRFVSFVEGALALDTELSHARDIAAWSDRLDEILHRFFDPDDDRLHELEAVRSVVDLLRVHARAARFRSDVPLSVIKSALRERLEVPGRAFLSGGVTFCAMVPMRSLPFEVVCMIGMNDSAFPRIRRPYGFDLIGQSFRKGDRSRRDDDRYLFLESLLCARRCLYASYVGRNVRDDSVIPPSVLVSELLDYIDQHFRDAGEGKLRNRLVTIHPLQAFSPRYFEGGNGLYSYSEAMRDAAALTGTGRRTPEAFISSGLPAPEEDRPRIVELDSLIRFFRGPARYLLRERLNIHLETAEEEIEGREPFAVDALTGYLLKQRLLTLKLRGDSTDVLAVERAGGELPHGRMGEIAFEHERTQVERFVAKIDSWIPRQRLDPIPVSLEVADVRLTGALTGASPDGLLTYRPAAVTVNDRVAFWIRHLALNAVRPQGVALTSRCIGQDVMLTLQPVDDPTGALEQLLQLYFAGLLRPLHFFPKTACIYFERGEIDGSVRNAWGPASFGDSPPGEADDAYNAIAFRGVDPLDAEFERNARIVFGTMQPWLEEKPLA